MSNENNQELLTKIVEQQSQLLEEMRAQKTRGNRDFWDRLNVMAPIIGASIMAIIGAYFTYTYNLQQLKVQEIQTIEKFIPHLIGTEKSKRAAILAISSLGNAKLATKVASIFASEGTAAALQSIAQQTNDTNDQTMIRDALIKTLDQLAVNYRNENRLDDAITAHQKSIAVKDAQQGRDNTDMAENLTKLSELYEKHGDKAMSEELARRAQTLRKRIATADGVAAEEADSTIRPASLLELKRGAGERPAADTLAPKTDAASDAAPADLKSNLPPDGRGVSHSERLVPHYERPASHLERTVRTADSELRPEITQ